PGPEYAAKIRQAQSLTEPGKRILAAASSGFLFDYHRNPIWNFDFMGFMSPPPGLPLTADWKKLEAFLDRKSADPAPPGPVAEFRDFLVRSGVDYLFFERDPSFVYYLKDLPYWTYIDYALISIARLTHKNLLNLARDRHAVFDDGNMIMLDLRQGRLPDDPPFIDSGAVFGVSRSLQEEGRRAEREDN
ncbi:MAG TPA: hypothetical protein VKA15_22675, partial [Isosphaeraceae bacterium]|nr:hypothetical protein [Isosphaeraceae bacterium]